MKKLFSQIKKWYGEPGHHSNLQINTDIALTGNSIEEILLLSSLIAQGQSVAFISGPQNAHKIIPHPTNISLSNDDFFRQLAKIAGFQHEITNNESELWNDRGNLLYEFGWKLESVECFLRAIALDSNLSPTWVNLGRYFMDPEIMDLAVARNCLERALEINPSDDVALANMGGVEVAQKNFKKAIEFCAKSIEVNNDNFVAHYYAGVSCMTLSNGVDNNLIRSALSHFKSCQNLLSQKPDAEEILKRYIKWCNDRLE
ncbi:hypothetical protein ES705_01059 [subsurface metagenome]|nr:hypothetical protein [Clostridia bacterium]TET14808.1 MAG: tetratricopeptide repeat protein [Actinomycetota bacterium]